MRRLYFKRKFVASILSGQKTTTIRRWRKARVTSGDVIFAPNVGRLLVTSCEPIDLQHLGAVDAQSDGFESAAALLKAVRSIYPDFESDGKQWFRVGFRLWSERQNRTKSAKPRKRLGKKARHALATVVRAELDKAVRLHGSLAPL